MTHVRLRGITVAANTFRVAYIKNAKIKQSQPVHDKSLVTKSSDEIQQSSHKYYIQKFNFNLKTFLSQNQIILFAPKKANKQTKIVIFYIHTEYLC